MVRRCWVNFQCQGALPIQVIVEQGPIALAADATGLFGHIFLSVFSPSLGEVDTDQNTVSKGR